MHVHARVHARTLADKHTKNTRAHTHTHAVREFVNKSAASAASLDYVKFQAVIKSAASAASLCGGRASGRLDCVFFFFLRNFWAR